MISEISMRFGFRFAFLLPSLLAIIVPAPNRAAKVEAVLLHDRTPVELLVKLIHKPKSVDKKSTCWGQNSVTITYYECGIGVFEARFLVLQRIKGARTKQRIMIRFREHEIEGMEFSEIWRPGTLFLFAIHRYLENGSSRYIGHWQREDRNGHFCRIEGDHSSGFAGLYSDEVTRRTAKKNDPDWYDGTRLECADGYAR